MNQRTMLLVAAGITAFVLVLLGGLTAYVTHPAASTASAASPASPSPQLEAIDPGQSPTEQGTAAESEAIYRQQLHEARAQLEEANSRLGRAYDELTLQEAAHSASGVQTSGVQTGGATITTDQAALIGAAAAPGARLLRAPELVNFQGTLAYELQFDGGAVYVDAMNGGVLDNAVAEPLFTSTFAHAGEDEDDEDDHNDGRYEDGEDGEDDEAGD